MRGGKLILLLAILGIGLGVAYFRLPLSVSKGSDVQTSPETVSVKEEGKQNPSPLSEASATPSAKDEKTALGSLAALDQAKVKVLDEIFKTKNDNDPRIDTELKDFSPEAKRALFSKYALIQAEKRNEKGTIAFLVGREIQSKSDVDFLKSILMEKPCLSLQDCSQAPAPHTGEEDHLNAMNETTARYPQLVSIRALIHRYQELMNDPKHDPGLSQEIIQAIRDAQNSPDPRIGEEATAALKHLGKL